MQVFDRVIFSFRDKRDAILAFAEHNRLEYCPNLSKNIDAFRTNEKIKNITGIDIFVNNNKVTVRTNLQKYYNKISGKDGTDDSLLTMKQSVEALLGLFTELGIKSQSGKMTYFELGLNLKMKHDPKEYINRITRIGDRDFYIDARQRDERQKTTEKHAKIKKYYKVYDKSFEQAEKKHHCDANLLRIESVFKRRNEEIGKLFSADNLERLCEKFFKEWEEVFFLKNIVADKGIRKSEVHNAFRIINFGKDKYMAEIKEQLLAEKISAKQYRTIREFIRDWDKRKDCFRVETDEREEELRSKMSLAKYLLLKRINS